MTGTLAPRTLRAAFITEPLRIAADQPHQLLISTVSISLTARFFTVDTVVHPFVAAVAAVGIEYAYLKGLSDAGYTKSVWGQRLIWNAFIILVIAGTYVLMKDLYHAQFLKNPDPWLGFFLALLHIIPMAALGLCSAMLHAEADTMRHAQMRKHQEESERIAAEHQREHEQRQREQQAWEDEQRRLRAVRAAEVEDERMRRLMDIETKAHAREVFARTAPANSGEQVRTANTAVFSASDSESASDDALRVSVVRTLREQPDANRSALAKQLGIGRTKLYKLIAEARTLGELEA